MCHPSPFLTILQLVMHIVLMLGEQRGHLGLGAEGASLQHTAAEGPEGFPQEELACPSQVIKMEVCFDKDTLGHFFPTELGQRPSVQRHLKKT